MRVYHAYLHDRRPPLMLRDGFSFWAFLFGPFWLLVHAAWIPGVVLFAVETVMRFVLHPWALPPIGLGIAWLMGLYGQSLRGWSLRRRGWHMAAVVAAPDTDAAYARLLAVRPAYRAAAAL